MTRFADLRSTRTAYEMHGAGAPTLLIHGAEANRESFAQLSSALSSRANAPLCVVSYDQRECGDTVSDGKPHSILDLAEDAAELMAKLGFKRFSVMGTSLGGRVAQALSIAYPDRVEALCLVNTWPLDRLLAQLNPTGVERLRTLRAGLPSTGQELAAMFYTAAHVAQHPALVQRFAHPKIGSRRNALTLEVHALPPERIQARTLCISGQEDQVVPTLVMRMVADHIARANLVTVPLAGHSIAVQAPATLAGLIADFVCGETAGVTPV
jgi:pimeloyl-ACP methyl ester carboxylesterase